MLDGCSGAWRLSIGQGRMSSLDLTQRAIILHTFGGSGGTNVFRSLTLGVSWRHISGCVLLLRAPALSSG